MKAKIITILLLFATMLSCKDQNLKTTQKSGPVDFKLIGLNHNKGLDYILNYILANRGSDKISLSQVLKLNKAASEEYFNKTYSNLSQTDREKIMGTMESLNQINTRQIFGRTNTATGPASDMLSQVAPYMTYNQKYYINNIYSTLETYDNNINAVQYALDDIESQVYSTMGYDEAAVVLSAISVARNSTYYWDSNLDHWFDVMSQTTDPYSALIQPRINGRIAWGWVVGMDVTAAVTVGILYSPAFVVPFVGWAFWGGSVVAGALITSGATAIISYKSMGTSTGSIPRIPL